MRILLAEDDRLIGTAIQQALKDAAYALDWVQDGESALTAIAAQTYDLMLLDLGLPRLDGVAVLTRLRQHQQAVPVIIITARDALEDRIQGLDLGADDYLVKPFAVDELLARIRAVARRHQGSGKPVLDNGVIELDPATHLATREGNAVTLSAREFALLQALMMRPGTILSRTELEDRIYGWNEEVESNAVEFIIHSLRKKLGSDAIKNVRGVGWMVAKGR
ncbi:response regulator [Candidatus Thiothrix sp. Deng01]|uniref:Response regulator n=1 Tax=Candidatus Thiothrix phosphatis TaxID=3112415 RepID=A0ABU6CYZ9_9GAMM|nr:response regulator [Candidatus Thiothrix sp. Deng01]MEB4591608.1 response regulator [Candidatus Thiothrix sp. Deng01]